MPVLSGKSPPFGQGKVGTTFVELEKEVSRKAAEKRMQFAGMFLLSLTISGSNEAQNPAAYDGNLDPNYRLDQIELNSKNGFKNYDYVPLPQTTLDWLKENYPMPGDAKFMGSLVDKEPGVVSQPDITVGRSVGAKAKNYEIMTPDGDALKLTEGSRITKVNVIAGKGVNREIDTVDILVDRYGGNASDWEKCKGFGYVDVDGESLKAELHWYQNSNVGKVAFKIKTQPGGEYFIYED